MSLAALLIANYSSSAPLYHYNNHNKKGVAEDAKTIASKAKCLRSKVGERDKLSCDYGVWFVTRGQQDLLYAACVDLDYPERVVFGMIQKIQLMIKEKDPQKTIEQRISKLSKDINSLCDQYKDARVDKVREAQFAVSELRDQLQTGVKKMFQNQDNLVQLNDKAALMKNYAQTFQKSSQTVQRTMFWRKWRYYIIIGVVLTIIFVLTGVVLYLGAH